jgi:hypothetical protein
LDEFIVCVELPKIPFEQAASIYLRFFLTRVWATQWMDPAEQADIGANLVPAALAVDNEPVNR